MKMEKLSSMKKELSYVSRKCLLQRLTAYPWTFIFRPIQFYQYFKAEDVIGGSVHSVHTALFMGTDTANNVPSKWSTQVEFEIFQQ